MNKPNTKKPLFAFVVGVALIATTLSACAPTSPQTGPESPAVGAPGEVQRITLEESKAAFDSGEAIFLDVRSASSYGASHVPGALSIPLAELQPRINELDPNQWIITYCTWPAEESSARAAEILLENGFTRVNPILGGFGAWTGAGYPVQSNQ